MSARHKRGGPRRRQRRRDLLAEIERLRRLLAEEREHAALLRREIEAPGSEDQTVYMPRVKLEHTPSVPLITPDGKRTRARTGPSWARDV